MFNLLVVFFTILSTVPIFLLIKTRRNLHKRLPPGSLGIPLIGESFSLLGAMRANRDEEWCEKRVSKYGPVSKLTLFGSPTIFIHGKDANKFVFTSSDGNTLNNQPPPSFRRILGKWNLLELSGEDHKRVKGALMAFLKPDALKLYIGKMENEIRSHLNMYWEGKHTVTVLPLMKTLTFNMMCSVLFGLEAGPRRENFVSWFTDMIAGLWSVPVNVPFTQFNHSIKASSRIHSMVMDIIHERRLQALERQQASPHQDLITSLLRMHAEDNALLLSDEEIVGNIMFLMVAGHETSSVLVTFLLRQLASDPVVYEAILKEQEEIAKTKADGELLTWEDLTKMKYTWRSALEMLRIVPAVFGGFRKAVKEVEFGGYIIPKGWQVFWVSSSTHMNKSIFSEPTKFDPERFNDQASIPPYCFVGFGGGARLCPGSEFARIETLIIMHYLVTRFTWKLCGKDNKFSRNLTPMPTQGLPIQIEPRKLPDNLFEGKQK